jgi:hypothetical protein
VTASERTPNWTWGVSYGQRTGYSDVVSFGVSTPIPLSPRERQDRDTAAKLALADKAEAELAEATRAASAEYRVWASDSQRLQERIERYRLGVVAPATALRHLSGFDLNQVVSEFCALRTAVLTLWEGEAGSLDSDDIRDLTRFSESIDQALAESVAGYSAKIDESRDTFLAILGHDLRGPWPP